MNNDDALDLHAPFAVLPQPDGSFHVRDGRGSVVATALDRGRAYVVALALNEVASVGPRELVQIISLTHRHPQGGSIEVRMPKGGVLEAIGMIRRMLDGLEATESARRAGAIGQA